MSFIPRFSGREIAGRLLGALLASVFPADCLLCARRLPWRQRGGVCHPCWGRIPWSPGLRTGSGPVRALFWAADYGGPVQRLIQGFKFEGMDYLGGHLGVEMASRLAPVLWPIALPHANLVVPVPLHPWRQYHRGYNQAQLLARPLAGRLGLPIDRSVLVRRRAGRRQLGLTRQERLRSLEGCFRVRVTAPGRTGHRALAGRTLLLVDDVVTTGATLEACARTLLRAGAGAVMAAVLARTPQRRS